MKKKYLLFPWIPGQNDMACNSRISNYIIIESSYCQWSV